MINSHPATIRVTRSQAAAHSLVQKARAHRQTVGPPPTAATPPHPISLDTKITGPGAPRTAATSASMRAPNWASSSGAPSKGNNSCVSHSVKTIDDDHPMRTRPFRQQFGQTVGLL